MVFPPQTLLHRNLTVHRDVLVGSTTIKTPVSTVEASHNHDPSVKGGFTTNFDGKRVRKHRMSRRSYKNLVDNLVLLPYSSRSPSYVFPARSGVGLSPLSGSEVRMERVGSDLVSVLNSGPLGRTSLHT